MIDVKALTEALFREVHAYIAPALAEITRQMAALDAKIATIPAGEKGEPGESLSVDDVRPMMEAEIAKCALDFERRASDIVQRTVDRIPHPQDGRDGMSLDGFDMALDGRTFTLSLECGDRLVTKEAKLPIPIYRGIYQYKANYETGDLITFGGSVWMAKKDNPTTRPPSDDWQLVVQRGRDAR